MYVYIYIYIYISFIHAYHRVGEAGQPSCLGHGNLLQSREHTHQEIRTLNPNP